MIGALLVLPGLAWAVVRVFGLERGWPLIPLVAFTPYVAILATAPLATALAMRRWCCAVVAGVTLTALAICVIPRAWGGPEPQIGGPVLRVLTTNMLLGEADPTAIVDLVRTHHVDLLAVQEYTPGAEHRLHDAGLDGLLPDHVTYPLDGVGGSALYSRFPLTGGGYRPLPPYFGQAYAVLHVPGTTPILVESAHPCAPANRSRMTCWPHDLAAEPAATPHGPVRILLGDFNATLDHASLRTLIATGYQDAASTVGEGWTATWPFDGKPIPGVTLDHVLVDRRVAVEAVHVYPVPRSDHRAVYARLTLPPA